MFNGTNDTYEYTKELLQKHMNSENPRLREYAMRKLQPSSVAKEESWKDILQRVSYGICAAILFDMQSLKSQGDPQPESSVVLVKHPSKHWALCQNIKGKTTGTNFKMFRQIQDIDKMMSINQLKYLTDRPIGTDYMHKFNYAMNQITSGEANFFIKHILPKEVDSYRSLKIWDYKLNTRTNIIVRPSVYSTGGSYPHYFKDNHVDCVVIEGWLLD